jgi:hypothetical protein
MKIHDFKALKSLYTYVFFFLVLRFRSQEKYNIIPSTAPLGYSTKFGTMGKAESLEFEASNKFH